MKINVSKIANLANIPLTDQEANHLESQLIETLTYIGHLNEVDTKSIKPTNNVTGLKNVMAEDIAQPSLTQEEALANTKDHQNGSFKVKGIFENQ